MSKARTEVLGIRVRRDLYDYYADYLNRLEKSYVTETVKAIFEQLVSDIKKKKESGEPIQLTPQGEQQLVVKVEHTLKAEDTTLRLYRRIEGLEKELARALDSLEQAKEQLEKERAGREKCIQELEALKKKPADVEKELTQLRQSHSNLLELANLVIYCFESQRCDSAKLATLLRQRLSKLNVQITKPNDILISLVQVTPK